MSELQQVQFPALLDSISTKKDGSFKIVIETREFSGDEAAKVFQYRQQEGYVTFTPNAISEVDIPDEPAETGQKTKSQRLRGVVFKLWQKRGSKGTFDEFYATYMENVIDLTKEKLD